MEIWQEEIQRDLAPFADPGSSITYANNDDWLTAEWTSHGRAQTSSFFKAGDGNIRVKTKRDELSYKAFLASSEMSDLLGLAGMTLSSNKSNFFIETKARLETGSDESPALELLRATLARSSEFVTNVVFVTGDAGAGKTEVLRELVRQQADRFRRGLEECLYLYVNAQGRALARLDEALATELQDLRAHLTYHAIPTLVRNGILIPIIDGFDELLGISGYDDAFSSLRRFVDDLDGRGQLIASTRSTYYEQEFLSRTNRTSLFAKSLRVEPITILPWHENEFRQYLNVRFAAEPLPAIAQGTFAHRMREAFHPQENRSLMGKPFFVAKTADLVLSGTEFAPTGLLAQLVEGYVERERVEKLLDKNGKPLLTNEQIRKIVQFICDEMWLQETRVLDASTVRIVAEISGLDEDIAAETHERMIERAPSMAFFRPSVGRDRIEFEHELFFAYFLGNTVADALLRDVPSLHSVLMRSPLPEHTADFAIVKLREHSIDIKALATATSAACTLTTRRSGQVEENAGALVASGLIAAAASEPPPHAKGITFQKLVFSGQDFDSAELVDCEFISLEFRRVDLRRTRFLSCKAKDTVLQEVLVDPGRTRLEIKDFDPALMATGLQIVTPDGIQALYRQDLIAEVLYKCGVPGEPPTAKSIGVAPGMIELLDNLMRKFDRTTIIWPDDQQHHSLKQNSFWPILQKLLLDSHLVTAESRIQHKGTPRTALRRNYLPHQIMAGADLRAPAPQEAKVFWTELRRVCPPPNALKKEADD